MTSKARLLGLWLVDAALFGVVAWRVGERERNLLTGMVFLAALGLAMLLLCELAAGLLRLSPEPRARLRLLAATIVLTLPALELLLRFGVGRLATYREKNGEPYVSLFEYELSSRFHVHPPNAEVVYLRPEFKHVRRTNSLGLSEREIPVEKLPGEYRIVALGDSYTEGMGTDYDGTWVKVAERALAAAATPRRVTTLNAGISGSDVPFEYVLLRDKLLPYAPDLVVVATNTSDVVDVSIMGGLERFLPDGRMRPGRPAPPWEWLYAISYTFRHVIHGPLAHDWRLLPRSQVAAVEREAVARIREGLDAFAELGRRQGFELLVVVLPTRWEAMARTWTAGFDGLLEQLEASDLHWLDLTEHWYRRGVMDRQNAEGFYWPLDGHLNPKGYEAMGKAVAEKVLELGLLGPQARGAAPAGGSP